MELFGELDGLDAVASPADHVDVRVGVEHPAQGLAHEGGVVGYQDTHGIGTGFRADG